MPDIRSLRDWDTRSSPAFRLLTAYPPADALPHDGNDVTGDDADEKLAVGIPLPAGLLSQEDLPILKEAE